MNELLLQASMGLSHIYHDIRVDSCRLVQLLLHHAAGDVVGSWPVGAGSRSHAGADGNGSGNAGAVATTTTTTTTGQSNENRILDGLRLVAGIGGRAGEGGQNGLNLLPGSKLVILDTLLAFVRAGLGKQGFVKGGAEGGWVGDKGKGKGAGGKGVAAKDLVVPQEIFTAFEPRYPTTHRISTSTSTSTPVNGKGKAKQQPPLLSIAKLSDLAFAETGALFDGWLVGQFIADGMLMDVEGGGGWDLASVAVGGGGGGGRFGGVDAGDGTGDEVGQALAVRTALSH
ncbi:hypothetical protein QFC24_004008 [Naganishia onofrii]|uniref:Uncharacterized protein n=1 Tax=Naganishia onofrii TaxID=1851511 RepID=A0ACC2XHU3_9TREE|nr:hypothetical protein QFC24_004008 [Naganishia onofrii]